MLGAEDVKKLQYDNPSLVSPKDISVTNNQIHIDGAIDEVRIAQVLGLASSEASQYSMEIKNLIDWARSNGAQTMDDILYEIRSLSNKLGSSFEEKKIKTLSRYIFLTKEKQRLDIEMDRLKA